MRHLKILIAILVGLAGLMLAILSGSAPFMLKEDVAENRRIHAAFERTAAYVSSNRGADGRVPAGLAQWQAKQGPEHYWTQIAVAHSGCEEDGFAKPPGDAFVLVIWRGEWFDCFAFPSRKTTLALSVGAFLSGGLGWQFGITFLLACGLIWLAIRLEHSARRTCE